MSDRVPVRRRVWLPALIGVLVASALPVVFVSAPVVGDDRAGSIDEPAVGDLRSAKRGRQIQIVTPPPPPPPPPPPVRTVTTPGRFQVALTFDDGPTRYTDQILDILAPRNVAATFFPIGSDIGNRRSTLRRAVVEGHSVQNHTWAHRALTSLSTGAIQTDLRRAAQEITTLGAPWPACYRPPYRATNSRVRSAAAAAGFREISWNVDTNDYLEPSPWTIRQRALASADGRGLNILFHDGGGDQSNTVAALPGIIDSLRARGYEFVRLCN